MTPAMIFFAIQAAIRLGRAGNQSLLQYARDREVLLPSVIQVPVGRKETIRARIMNSGNVPEALQESWIRFVNTPEKDIKLRDYEAIETYMISLDGADSQNKPRLDSEAKDAATAYWMVRQWSENKAPIGPGGRFALAIANVAIDYVALEPSLFGANGRAEPLIKALAENFKDLIPDNVDELGSRNQAGERLAQLFFQGGLKAIAAHPEAIFEEAHLKDLVADVLPVLANRLPTKSEDIFKRDALLELAESVSQAAVGSLAKNQEAFLGRKFADGKALGALTRVFLLQVAQDGIDKTLQKQGMLSFYQASLALIGERPELVAGKEDHEIQDFLRPMVAGVAKLLSNHKGGFDEAALRTLAGDALLIAAHNSTVFLRADDDWSKVLENSLDPILSALKTSLDAGNPVALKRLVSGDGLLVFARIVLTQVAKTPGMLTGSNAEKKKIDDMVKALAEAMTQDQALLLTKEGWFTIVEVAATTSGVALLPEIVKQMRTHLIDADGAPKNPLANNDFLVALIRILLEQVAARPGIVLDADKAELQRIVATIARAIATDKDLLLTREDWLAVASSVATEAASNPGRLFGFDPKAPQTALVEPLIQGLLRVAAEQWRGAIQVPGPKPVLFGATLREAILTVCTVAAGNVAAALANAAKIDELAKGLARVVADVPQRFGSKEWLRLYRLLLPDIVAGKALPDFTADNFEKILIGRA